MDLVISNADVGFGVRDIGIDDGKIATFRAEKRAARHWLDARGGAVLPGLHDHHLHLLSMAAAYESVWCGPPSVRNRADLQRVLMAMPDMPRGIRGIGYDESVAGELDKAVLDDLAGSRAVRIQHRSGAWWYLNSLALADLGIPVAAHNGRIFRDDTSLYTLSPLPSLAPVGQSLARYGITGVTDATPETDAVAIGHIDHAVRSGELAQRVVLLGADSLIGGSFGLGPYKIVLDEGSGLDYPRLCDIVTRLHASGRPVALHCITRAEVTLAVAVLEDVGPLPGDRLEHASLLSSDLLGRVRAAGTAIVTQPDFIRRNGDRYLADIEETDDLYRCRSSIEHGIAVGFSSDAPYGELDPWQAMRSAVERRSSKGESIGSTEAVSARQALNGYLASPLDLAGPPRRLTVGAPADLCVLSVPWETALDELDATNVMATVVDAEIVYMR